MASVSRRDVCCCVVSAEAIELLGHVARFDRHSPLPTLRKLIWRRCEWTRTFVAWLRFSPLDMVLASSLDDLHVRTTIDLAFHASDANHATLPTGTCSPAFCIETGTRESRWVPTRRAIPGDKAGYSTVTRIPSSTDLGELLLLNSSTAGSNALNRFAWSSQAFNTQIPQHC